MHGFSYRIIDTISEEVSVSRLNLFDYKNAGKNLHFLFIETFTKLTFLSFVILNFVANLLLNKQLDYSFS